jgi:acyl carrier protein
MQRSEILEIINEVMSKRGRPTIKNENQATREVNFRSLDFSEVAIRIEMQLDRELTFDAASMRQIQTVKDVVDFFEEVTSQE